MNGGSEIKEFTPKAANYFHQSFWVTSVFERSPARLATRDAGFPKILTAWNLPGLDASD